MPLLWLSLAFLAGVAIAASITLPTLTWLILAAGAVLLAALFSLLRRAAARPKASAGLRFARRLPPFLYSLLPCLFCLGAARFQAGIPAVEPGFIAWYNDIQTPFVVEGVVVAPPDRRDTYLNLRLQVDQLHLQGDFPFQPVHGLLLVRLPPHGDWQYGDRLRLQGQLQTPPENENFSYRDYLAHQGIYTYLNWPTDVQRLLSRRGNPLLAALYAFKGRALLTVYQLYPDPEASLLAGILLGVETGIPQRVQEAFKATGTSHIIAISGFNMAIVAALFANLFGRLLGRWRGTAAAILGIMVYTVLVGASPSVVRAAIMGCLGLLAHQIGRRQMALNTLAITAAVMAAVTPHTLGDPGFQLSFSATLGLILYAEPFADGFRGWLSRYLPSSWADRLSGLVSEYFLFTLAAQLFTLPVIAYHFRRISLIALVVNPLVLPVQPPIMIFGGLAVLLGMLWLPLGRMIGALVWPLVAYTIRVIEGMAAIPGGNLILGEVGVPVVALIYLGLIAWAIGVGTLRGWAAALKPGTALTVLMVLAALSWRAALSAPDGRLHVTLLDVSAAGRSGDAVLIRTPTGRNLLIDGGRSATKLSDALGRRLPPGNRDLDWLVVALPGDEQLTAIPAILDRFPPANVLWAGPTHGTRAARSLQSEIVQRGIPQMQASPAMTLDLGNGAALQVLTVGSRGAVLLLNDDRFRLLLPLGVDFEAFEQLRDGAAIGRVSALLLADAAYAPTNPPQWIERLQPQVILVSIDAAQAISPEMQQTLAGYTVLRTDQNGGIELSTDGQQMWVMAERK